jgi:hypothetical protein
MSSSDFAAKLAHGKVAEGLIARWLMARGNSVLPVYEIEKSHGKGPQLFAAPGERVAPDMVTFTNAGALWIEAKHKSVFTWHRKSERWTTGIDLRHYFDYLHVWRQSRTPVWLMFFHRESVPSAEDLRFGCPHECPTGLFGGKLDSLFVKESHRVPPYNPTREGCVGHGHSGMVYWERNALSLLASRDEVLSARDCMRAATGAAPELHEEERLQVARTVVPFTMGVDEFVDGFRPAASR